MFVFIIPLRSKKTSKDWNKVISLLNETLQSVLNQTSPNFHIVIVCNDHLEGVLETEKISVVSDNFEIPSTTEQGYKDIQLKMKRGMMFAKTLSPRFVMKLDADDLVSNQIVSFSERNMESSGWYIATGYVYEVGKSYLYLRPKFPTMSGSSHIFRIYNDNDFPKSIDSPQREWLEPLAQHLNVNKKLKEMGRPLLDPLPFPGAVYRISSENMIATPLSDGRFTGLKSWLWKMICYRRLNEKLIKEFNFPLYEN